MKIVLLFAALALSGCVSEPRDRYYVPYDNEPPPIERHRDWPKDDDACGNPKPVQGGWERFEKNRCIQQRFWYW